MSSILARLLWIWLIASFIKIAKTDQGGKNIIQLQIIKFF